MIAKLREKILSVKAKEEVVNVSEWGVDVKIKEMTAKDKYDIINRVSDLKTKKVDVARMTIEFVIACTYDPESGDKVFDDEDFDSLGNMPSGGIDKIFKEVSKINKLEDIDETAKN